MRDTPARQREARARRYAARIRVGGRLVAVNVEHGKPGTYTNHGCQCERCTAAHAAKQRRWRAGKS